MGTWVEIKRSWHDNTLTNCALCGRLVPRMMWQVEIGEKTLPFCNEECEGLYRSYWLPKYGDGADSEHPTGEGEDSGGAVGLGDFVARG